jgi:RNA polymerase sigma factor (sigma-70 family)
MEGLGDIMTDYELVCKAKTDQNYMYCLYKKYENLIQKNYKSFIQTNISRGYEYEDYMSEAYLILNKAVKSFREDRIKYPDKWTFTNFFSNRLYWNNVIAYKALGEKKNKKYDREKNMVFTSLYAFINRLQQIDTTVESVEHTVWIEKFLSLLTAQEKTVMKFYLIPGKKSSIPTMKEVGERMGLTKQRISYIVNKMKIKWQSLDI